MNIDITAIIPVYNCEKYISEAIESILKQTYPVREIIVVNDGSSDNTPIILNDLAKSISILKIFNQENKGRCNAFNRGVKEANFSWIGRLGAPDCKLSN